MPTVRAAELCQHIERITTWDSDLGKVVDLFEPLRCNLPEVVPWQHAWTPHVGPLGHRFTKFTEVLTWRI